MKSKVFYLGILLFLFSSCSKYSHVLRKPSIYDGDNLGAITLTECDSSASFCKRENIQLPPLKRWLGDKETKRYSNMERFLERNGTTAFLVIKKDTIIYENYFNGVTDTSLTQVFSVTKPIVTSLLSLAIEDGLIEDLHQPVTNYIDFKRQSKNLEQLEIYHLAQMISGINHNDYIHLLRTLKLYYSKNMDEMIAKLKVARTPGKKFAYKSVSTQVIGTILEELYAEDIDQVFAERVWNKLGPEYPTRWSIDSEEYRNLKYYGGINAHPRDLAKYGRMYMNDGKVGEEQIIPKSWIDGCEEESERRGK